MVLAIIKQRHDLAFLPRYRHRDNSTDSTYSFNIFSPPKILKIIIDIY